MYALYIFESFCQLEGEERGGHGEDWQNLRVCGERGREGGKERPKIRSQKEDCLSLKEQNICIGKPEMVAKANSVCLSGCFSYF